MANVSFLRGSQAKVDELLTSKTGIIEGAFYLTNDSNRLYFGKAVNDLVALNQGVITVSAVSALPGTGALAGQFYYATSENVLCVYNGTKWVQINPDTNTTISTHTHTVASDGANTAKVTATITDSAGKSLPASHKIVGAGVAQVSVSGDTITITVPETEVPNDTVVNSIDVSVSNNKVTIGASDSNSTNTIASGEFTIAATGLATAKTSGSTITIDVKAPEDKDTKVSAVTVGASATGNVATVTTTVRSDDNDSKADSLTITGGENVTVTGSEKNVTIASKDTKLRSINVTVNDTTTGEVVISATDTAGTSIASGSFKFKGEDGISLYGDEDGVIKIANTKEDPEYQLTGGARTSGWSVELEKDSGSAGSVTINPSIKYGSGSNGASTETATFANGATTLNVYTKAQVDDLLKTKLQAAEAMHFMGVVENVEELETSINKGCTNGAVYKASKAFTIVLGDPGVKVKAGDVIIVTGEGDSDGNIDFDDAEWNIIPSGDDIDIYYGEKTASGLNIVQEGNGTVASVDFKASTTPIQLGFESALDGKGVTVDVKHATINQNDKADTAKTQTAKGSLEINAVTGVTRDNYGHITGVTTQKFTVSDTDTHNHLKEIVQEAYSVANTATITTTVAMDDENKSSSISIKSLNTNLTVTAEDTTGVSLNLVWGTF